MARQPDWTAIRAEFPALAGCTYLNTATYGQTPRRCVDAVMAHFVRRDALACGDFLSWFDDADAIRASAGGLVNAPAGDIAFVPNASTALAWIFNGIEWRRGDRILSLPGEFPNNLYYPALQAELGVEFAEAPWEELEASLDERVRLVLLSTVNYSTGFRPPLEGLSRRLKELGALLYVDGTQSVGALRFDCAAVQPDMLAVHGYKWLLSPNGAGFAYVSPRLREMMRPSVVGWRSDRGWREVNALSHGTPVFSDAAERYEGGMPNFPCLYGMGASIDMMLETGPEAIEERVMELSGQCAAVLAEHGGVIAHPGSQIIAARFPDRDADALAESLRARGVLVSARHGRLRVSAHFYNDEADLERLNEGLRRG